MVVRIENESDIPVRNNGIDRDEGQSSQQQPFHIQYSDIIIFIYSHVLTAVVSCQIQMFAQYFTPVHCTVFLLLT